MESPKLKHVLHTQPLDADDPILSEDDIGKVLAEAGEVTFSELKSAASFLSNDLEGRASKKDIQSLFDFCEKKYAHASDLALIANHVGGGSDQSTNISLIASQLETYAKKDEMVAMASYVASHIDTMKNSSIDVTISAAQVLALGSTPITLIGAPGAGRYVELVRVEMFLDYNSAAYAGAAGKDISVEYSSGGTSLVSIECTGLMDQASDQRRCMNHSVSHNVVVNEAIVVKTLSGSLTAGNSPLKIRIDYRLIDVLI